MPFALLIVGIVLVVAASRNKQDDLFTLIKGDFTGTNNFIYWFVSILIIGSLGYIPKLKPLSTALLVLVVIVLVLTKGKAGTGGGLFNQFVSQLSSTTKTSTTDTTNQTQNQNPLQLPVLDYTSLLGL